MCSEEEISYQTLPWWAYERRSKPRIYGKFPATLRVRQQGGTYQESTTLDNLSTAGFYLVAKRFIPCNTRLFTVLHLKLADDKSAPGLCIAMLGVVKRIEARTDGNFGVGALLLRYRVL